MKKIILEEKRVEIELSEIEFTHRFYIAYRQKSINNLSYAVLLKQSNGLYAFRSLKYPENKGTYEAATPKESVMACIVNKRMPYIFSSMEEMLKAMGDQKF